MRVGCSLRGAEAASNVLALVRYTPQLEPRSPASVALPSGELHIVLGRVGDAAAEEEALIWAAVPPVPYPDAAKPKGLWLREVLESIAKETAALASSREAVDWPCTFSIDNASTRDIDDVISIRKSAGDASSWDFAVTISDVASLVPAGCRLDDAAYAGGETLYGLTGDALRPMLPRELSEEALSLLPSALRLGLTMFFSWDGAATFSGVRFAPTRIVSQRKFDYETVVHEAETMGWQQEIDVMRCAARALGAHMGVREDLGVDAHTWIMAFMVWYNVNAGVRLFAAQKGGVLCSQASFDASAEVRAAVLASIDASLTYLAHPRMLYCAVGDMATPDNLRAHASSPIRRYADLENQRALLALPLRAACAASSSLLANHLNERRAAIKKYARNLVFTRAIDPRGLFSARAFFVCLDDSTSAAADDPEPEDSGADSAEAEPPSAALDAAIFFKAMAKERTEKGRPTTRASFWVPSWGKWVSLRVAVIETGEDRARVLSRDEESEVTLVRGSAYSLTGFADLRSKAWRRYLRFRYSQETRAQESGSSTPAEPVFARVADWTSSDLVEGEIIY